jgi:PAS domain S-box-containing protein
MGVAATLVASLIVGGKLWGLVACHHYVPRLVQPEIRAACELLSELMATRIAALESFSRAQAELSVRRLEQRMVEALARDGDWREALFDSSHALLQAVGATGSALLFEGQIVTAGEVPGTQQLRDIGAWLDRQPRAPIVSTASLGTDEPAFAPQTAVVSGLLAAPISESPGEYLIWFRPEQIQTLTWGGDPNKAVVIGDNPMDLSPRRSFVKWHQLVEGRSEQWSPADISAARVIGQTVADVVLQFRSVQMLIAQDHLEQVSRQVGASGNPVIIADPAGQILLTNEAFEKLLRAGHPHLLSLDDLPPFFAEDTDVTASLRTMLSDRQAWRAEVRLRTHSGETKPLLVRGDPVFASRERILGYVLLFTDLTEKRAAESARRRFQESLIDRHRITTVRLDSKADLVYRNIRSAILDNAQLAALEITDTVETASIPEMLESVRGSVVRTTALLDQLVALSNKAPDSDRD